MKNYYVQNEGNIVISHENYVLLQLAFAVVEAT